jgi:hypothetical protein
MNNDCRAKTDNDNPTHCRRFRWKASIVGKTDLKTVIGLPTGHEQKSGGGYPFGTSLRDFGLNSDLDLALAKNNRRP